MSLRPLSAPEAETARKLRKLVGDVAYLQPTNTGLRKGLMDATAPVRELLLAKHVHDYTKQKQGKAGKVLVRAKVIERGQFLDRTASLYRPKTKRGDPRLWFSSFGRTARAGDTYALFVHNRILHALNVTRHDLGGLTGRRKRPDRPDLDLLSQIGDAARSASEDLLCLLRSLPRWIPSDGSGDTAVGRILENWLGIKMNSSKQPDFKGIELKAARTGKRRKQLFGMVPDWADSRAKSCDDILAQFGYARPGGMRRLNCTIGLKPNPQGLGLIVNEKEGLLLVADHKHGCRDVMQWKLDTLMNDLASKHHETFWIEARTRTGPKGEEFSFRTAVHTRSPYILQLTQLVERGLITLDIRIKRRNGRRIKNGGGDYFSFKLKPEGMVDLFPPSETYDVTGQGPLRSSS